MLTILGGILVGGFIGFLVGLAIIVLIGHAISSTPSKIFNAIVIFTLGNCVLLGEAMGGYLAAKDFWGRK
jgi:hypothetical protein